MNMKKLIGMAVMLVLLAGVAVWQRSGREVRHRMPSDADAALFKGVDLNAITRLEVTQSSNHVVLLKKDGRWSVDSLYGYPADFDRLADALRKAAEVKTGRPVRAGNVAAAEFGLDDAAKRIVLKTGDGKETAAVTVGARREASATAGWASQFFVRRNDSEAVYLVDYDFRPFSEKPADWISKELLSVQSDDIVAVQSGEVKMKLDGASWTLEGLNAETEELQSTEAGRLRSALQYLNCTTVVDPAKSDAELGFDKPDIYTAQTKDGFTYTVKLGAKTADGRYVRISAEGKADQVDKLNEKLSKWTYSISTYAAESLLIPRDKLVKAKGKEETPAENQ
jgi:hypothetical protein